MYGVGALFSLNPPKLTKEVPTVEAFTLLASSYLAPTYFRELYLTSSASY